MKLLLIIISSLLVGCALFEPEFEDVLPPTASGPTEYEERNYVKPEAISYDDFSKTLSPTASSGGDKDLYEVIIQQETIINQQDELIERLKEELRQSKSE